MTQSNWRGIYDNFIDLAVDQPALATAVARLLDINGDSNYLDQFRNASETQLQTVEALVYAVAETWAARHNINVDDLPGVIAELNRLRARSEAQRLFEAEAGSNIDYDDFYLPRSALADLQRGEPLIDGALDRHALIVVSGRDQSYKSFLALEWLLCLACGIDWRGHATERTRGLYVIGEGAWGLDPRVTAFEQHHGVTVDDEWFVVRRAPVNLFRGGAALDELLERIDGQGFGFVVFDTLRRNSAGANLNLETDAGVVITALDAVRDVTDNGSAGFVAHSDKTDRDTRGSGALEDDADIVWRAKLNDESGTVRFHLAKRRDGPDGLSFCLRPKPIIEAQSLVLDDALPGLHAAKPKHADAVLTELGKPVFSDGASATTLSGALGLASNRALYAALNWLMEHGHVTKRKVGRSAVYVRIGKVGNVWETSSEPKPDQQRFPSESHQDSHSTTSTNAGFPNDSQTSPKPFNVSRPTSPAYRAGEDGNEDREEPWTPRENKDPTEGIEAIQEAFPGATPIDPKEPT